MRRAAMDGKVEVISISRSPHMRGLMGADIGGGGGGKENCGVI